MACCDPRSLQECESDSSSSDSSETDSDGRGQAFCLQFIWDHFDIFCSLFAEVQEISESRFEALTFLAGGRRAIPRGRLGCCRRCCFALVNA